MVGTEFSRLPSKLYNENVYMMSKLFVKTALDKTPEGLEEVVKWLYLRPGGRRLLRHVIEDSEKLVDGHSGQASDDQLCKWLLPGTKISTGALVLLRRHLEWMKEYEERETLNTT